MAGLAGLAVEKGHKVTGQDKAYYPPMSSQLKNLGINENLTEDISEDLKNCDLVIIGNSLSRGNKCVEYILDKNLNYYSGPEWIKNFILKDKFVFVVSGTHGKTTTTSMLIKILKENGNDPSYLLGGIYQEDNISFKLTKSKYFIIEGDEYDTSFFDKRSKFVHYKPNTLIINNIEFDHSDIFEDISEIKKQFHYLIRTMSSKTNIVYKKDDKNIEDVLNMGFWSKVINFKKVDNIENIFGNHNLENAAAAISAAESIGINVESSLNALKKFSGVKRRLELIETEKFTLYDDFAHHPTAVKETLNAVSQKHPGKNINVFFEIRSNSMVAGTHKKNFYSSFIGANKVFIYSGKKIKWFEPTDKIKIFDNLDTIISEIISSTENVDIVILMSNGDTSDIINKIKYHEK
tara:strand:+ start:15436 stop:16653 length:1218 start_codon:yes stop_codon:yes gene_type:complete